MPETETGRGEADRDLQHLCQGTERARTQDMQDLLIQSGKLCETEKDREHAGSDVSLLWEESTHVIQSALPRMRTEERTQIWTRRY